MHLYRCWHIVDSASKFLPSDFFQMDEYMNMSCLFALAAFAQNQQLDIHLQQQNRPLSLAGEFSKGLHISGHYIFFKFIGFFKKFGGMVE